MSFPQIIDALSFCLQAEETIKTNFYVDFGSETINIYLKERNSVEVKPS